jgi:hypothetical protein
MPTYNDWQSLRILLQDLGDLHTNDKLSFEKIFIVNDGSTFNHSHLVADIKFVKNVDVHILHLIANVGHQRAIAIASCYIANNSDLEKVVVMDSDGEDDPQHIRKMIDLIDEEKGVAVVATRSKRHEKIWFRASYWVFKFLYRTLTGHTLNFGNFSVLQADYLKKLIHMPELWNNYPATILKSKAIITRVPIPKSPRNNGKSKLTISNFIQHGFGAVSVFSEIALIRILYLVGFLTLILTSGILGVFSIRVFTDLAISGWASLVAILLTLSVLQIGLFTLTMVISLVYRRNSFMPGPIDFYKNFIERVEKVEFKS